jgi:hypothetical protein
MKIKVDIGNGEKYVVTQSVGDLKAGYEQGDLSRISAVSGADGGVHTGARSETVSRHGVPMIK